MFQRSEQPYNVRYANYVGDGKTFKGILDSNPYGNFVVKKKKCIGHVQKRMDAHLCKLKKENPGIEGKRRLTGKLIDELTIYCGQDAA